MKQFIIGIIVGALLVISYVSVWQYARYHPNLEAASRVLVCTPCQDAPPADWLKD